MKPRTRTLGALFVVIALGAAACGDDDKKTQAGKSSDTDQEAPTKDAFIAAADKICAVNNDKFDEIFGSLFSGGEPTPADAQEGLGKALDIYDDQIVALRGLRAPEADEAEIAGLLDEFEKAAADGRAGIAEPDAALVMLNTDEDPFGAINEKMAAYGFADCSGEGPAETEVFGGEELSADELDKATKVDVKGLEFSYQGVPASLPAGPAVFNFTNGGAVNHEFVVVQIKEGVSAAEATAKAKENLEDESFIEQFLGGVFALPGEHGNVSFKLVPGLYGYACSVEDESGVQHVKQGMIGTFTVAG
jgi:hypothetical protein